jgi:rubrerythrin
MPLTNFGSILNFAEEKEKINLAFYESASNNPELSAYQSTFKELITAGAKHIKLVQRSRRENVTEMILEPINDFVRAPFVLEPDDALKTDLQETIKRAIKLEESIIDYYTQAGSKIKALPEVTRVCKMLVKKHKVQITKLESL